MGLSIGGTDQNAGGYSGHQVGAADFYTNGTYIHMTSPATASAVEYRVRIKSPNGTTCYQNPVGTQDDLILVEVAP